MSKIHLKRVLETLDGLSGDVSFSFTYAKKDGKLVHYKAARISSMHAKGATINLLIDGDNKPKTFRKICLTSFNGAKIYI